MTVRLLKLKNLKEVRHPLMKFPEFVSGLIDTENKQNRARLVCAGGAVRDSLFGGQIQDYDMFVIRSQNVSDSEAKQDHDNLIQKTKGLLAAYGAKIIFECPEGKLTSFDANGVKIQLISPRESGYDSLEDLVDSFDFHACQFVFDHSSNSYNVWATRRAIASVRKKVLTLHDLTYPTATVNRLGKYKAKGYYIGDCIKDVLDYVGFLHPDTYLNSFPEDTLYID